MKQLFFYILFLHLTLNHISAQSVYWQQKVKYNIEVIINSETNRFSGTEKLLYINNSPDKLDKLFFHLYWNAFQPKSMMDIHQRDLMKKKTGLPEWKDRIQDRIEKLKPDETGYQKIKSLKINGKLQDFKIYETIMEITLNESIKPNASVSIELEFEAQVPLQIRRSGRDNPEIGVKYSMSQWYPKICEYDKDGWHPTPYVAREFYGVWGDYKVNITIDKNYILGATGMLLNEDEIGYGYNKIIPKIQKEKLTWKFVANNVHDFVWTADKGYKHINRKILNGPELHLLYVNPKNDLALDTSWNALADAVIKVFPFIEKKFGKYAYPQFSVLQGGDGGMEYPMACLVADANIGSTFHEMIHSWYYGMLATNESLYPWMDEGFTCFAYDLVWDYYLADYVETHPGNTRAKGINDYFKSLLPRHHSDFYTQYFQLQKSIWEEPLSTHADHFQSNAAYEIGSYAKGAIFLEQLGYIVGNDMRDKILLTYYQKWKFKHPTEDNFIRIAEEESGIKLDWYKEYWINSTKSIDYGIDSVWADEGKTKIQLHNYGTMPMPIDLNIKYKDGRSEIAYTPQYLMFGSKSEPEISLQATKQESWKWTNPTYILVLESNINEISEIEIDASQRMADINRENNRKKLNIN